MTPETREMMLRVCGLSPELLEEFGLDPAIGLTGLDHFVKTHHVDYICAHNGQNFDQPLLKVELERNGVPATQLRSLPWIDTRADIPFPTEPDSRKLKHLAGDHGFLNPFPHRALFDVLTMLKVLSHYDINEIIEYQKIPWVTVQAVVGYADRQLAKDKRFSWEKLGTETFNKMWVKKIKADKLEEEQKACTFKVVKIG